jgi:hypothetical protein
MYDKAKLGTRYVCFQCGTKFYDLNRADALCPECGANQAEAPIRSWKDMLASGRTVFPDLSSSSSSSFDSDADDGDDDLDGMNLDDDDDGDFDGDADGDGDDDEGDDDD